MAATVFGVSARNVNTVNASDTVNAPLAATAPTATTVYWGAAVANSSTLQAPDASAFNPGGAYYNFEQHAGKKMSIIHYGQAWKANGTMQNFNTTWANNVRAHGSIPLLDWGSWALGGGPTQPSFKLSTIYGGTYDSYIKQFAIQVKAWAHPFFLRFDWEMNGTWQFPWAEQINGNQPGDYIKAWRHVHDIFTQNGANNVSWVWCPNISGNTTRSMASLYPGDAYVNWSCLDGYNKNNPWLGFYTLFTGYNLTWLNNSYKEITTVAPAKPIMLGEFASLEAGDGGAKKAFWTKDALTTQVPINFPKVKAIVWFNWNDNNPSLTWPIESSAAAQSAFAQGIGISYYAANNFAGLSTSPIPPIR
jgi:hypothetical protein